MRASLKELQRLQRNLGLKSLKPRRKAGRSTKGVSLRSSSALEAEFARQLRAAGIKGWIREYKFHPERRFRFDFAFPVAQIALECHGGTFSGGRHTSGVGFAKDREKSNLAQILGWIVLEATADDVKNGKALDWLQQALMAYPTLEKSK